MSQTLLLLEKGTNPGFPKLKPDVSSPQAKMLALMTHVKKGDVPDSRDGAPLGQMGLVHHKI